MATPVTLIDITETIVISENYKTVFDYYADYTNDKYWRKEINNTVTDSEFIQEGLLLTEDSYLSGKIKNYINTLTCTAFKPETLIICETTQQAKFWSKSIRQVEQFSGNQTKVIYRLQFNLNIVKYGLGFRLPAFLVKFYTRQTMKKYLAELKQVIEKRKHSLVKTVA